MLGSNRDMAGVFGLAVALSCLLGVPASATRIAQCPLTALGQENYCRCLEQEGRSGPTMEIICTFDSQEDVILTSAIFPFRNSRIVSAYVRISTALSLRVTSDFLEEWQGVPATALDVWHVGTVTFEPLAYYHDPHIYSPYRTSSGIGIVDCFVPEIPPKFMRDRDRGGLTIKDSRIGVIRPGALYKIKEIRYLVVEFSSIDIVEGPIAAEGMFILSQRRLHRWSGFRFQNVNVNYVASGSFNITHSTEVEKFEVSNCEFKSLNTGAFTVVGNLNVSFAGNLFNEIQNEALSVIVLGEVNFSQNLIKTWAPDALKGITCIGNSTFFDGNTVHVAAEVEIARNMTPFHDSCGNPQIFTVINNNSIASSSTSLAVPWTLGVLAVIVLLLLVMGIFMYRQRGLMMRHYKRDTFIFLRSHKVSESVTINPESSSEVGEASTGVTNPMYEEASASEQCESA